MRRSLPACSVCLLSVSVKHAAHVSILASNERAASLPLSIVRAHLTAAAVRTAPDRQRCPRISGCATPMTSGPCTAHAQRSLPPTTLLTSASRLQMRDQKMTDQRGPEFQRPENTRLELTDRHFLKTINNFVVSKLMVSFSSHALSLLHVLHDHDTQPLGGSVQRRTLYF